jgi:hypothetical protein
MKYGISQKMIEASEIHGNVRVKTCSRQSAPCPAFVLQATGAFPVHSGQRAGKASWASVGK